MYTNLDELLTRTKEAQNNKEAVSLVYQGNVVDLFEDFTYGFSNTVYDVLKESKDVLVDPEAKVSEYGEGLTKMLQEATPHIDIRYRYEFVNQDTKKEAKASTISTKLGLKTGKFKGV